MRLHVRAPAGTKIEKPRRRNISPQVEREIRRVVGEKEVDVILDNIGLPYSGINIALSDSATVGPMDGEILISLKEKHTPTAEHMADLRRESAAQIPQHCGSSFSRADIVNQVLNFGQPRSGSTFASPARMATPTTPRPCKILADMRKVPGVVDAHIFQVPDAPAINLAVGPDARRRGGASPSRRYVERPPGLCLSSKPRMVAAELLAQSRQFRQLSAGRADADLPRREHGRSGVDAGHDRRRGSRTQVSC